MAEVTARLRLVVDSTGLGYAGEKLRDLRVEAKKLELQARETNNVLRAVGGALAAAFSVDFLRKAVDDYTSFSNAVRLAVGENEDLISAQKQLAQTAVETFSTLKATGQVFQGLERGTRGFIVSQKELAAVTGTVLRAVALTAPEAEAAQGALIQFGQALASNFKTAGQELQSVIEQTPGLAEAIGRGLGQIRGVAAFSGTQVKALAGAQQLTSQEVFKALQQQEQEVNKLFNALPKTVDQALTRLKTSITNNLGVAFQDAQRIAVGVIVIIADNLEKIIPIALGVAAALGTIATAGAIGSVLKGIVGIVTAISPVGLAITAVAVAVGLLVANASDIAEWATGVRDAGAVVQATFEVLGPTVSDTLGQIGSFLSEAIRVTGETTIAIGKFGIEIASALVSAVPPEAVEGFRKWADGVLKIVASVAAFILEALSDAFSAIVEVAARGVSALSRLQFVPDGLRAQLADASSALSSFSKSIDANAGQETIVAIGRAASATVNGVRAAAEGTSEALEQIKVRSAEIAKDNERRREGVRGLASRDGVNDGEVGKASGEVKKALQDYKEIQDTIAGLKAERAGLLLGPDGEREAQILKTQADLLKSQGAYYKTLGAEAQKRARADAETIVSLRRGNEALEARNKILRDQEDQEFLVDAARGGRRQEEIAREVLNLRREIADISVEDATAIATQNQALAEQLEIIREQRELLEAPFTGLADNLEDAIINGGRDGTNGLRQVFKSFLGDLRSSFVKSVFAPLKRSLSDLFAGGDGGAIGALLQRSGLGGIVKLASSALPAVSGAITGLSLGRQFSDLLGLKKGTPGRGIVSGAIGGAAGGILGGTAAGLAVGAPVATALGIGASLGPIGAAIGAIVGVTLALIKGKPSNLVGQTVFDPSTGRVVGSASRDQSKGSLANLEAAQGIQAAISEGLQRVLGLTGGNFGDLLINAEVGRRGTRIGRQGPNGEIVNPLTFETSEEGLKQAIAAGFSLALGNLSGGDAELTSLAKALGGENAPIDDIVSVLTSFSDALKIGKPAAGQYEQALNSLRDAYVAGVAAAKGSADAEKALSEARELATDRLRAQFLRDIEQQRFAQTGDVRGGFADVAKEAAAILRETVALFGDGAKSLDVRSGVFQQFFEQAIEAGRSVDELTSKLADFQKIAADAGESAGTVAEGLQRALASQKDVFNKQVQTDISQYLDGTLQQLEALLKAQDDRRKKAEALGADLSQVARLTSLELDKFFRGLSDQAVEEVNNFLGLFQEASDTVARNLDLSRQDLESRAQAFEGFAQQFKQLQTDLAERFIAASPREGIDILKGRSLDLLRQVGLGNESAAQALPQVLNSLVDSARKQFGNTSQFQDVLKFVLDVTGQAEKASLDVKTAAERQIEKLDESNDILSDIRDILKSSQAFNALLQSGNVASSDQLLALIQQGAGLTPAAANDNAATLSVTGLIAQSLSPVILPIADSIKRFTEQLQPMVQYQRLTIDAIDRGAERVAASVNDLDDRMERVERINAKMLIELERLNLAA